jgi:hypothetical protein
MKTFRQTIITLLLTASTMCHAVLIGNFPGLDKAIEQANTIAIIRIDEHIQPAPSPNLTTRHRCMVYQTLKGDLKAGEFVPIDLMDTRASFVSTFALYSTHLVFLSKSGESYRSLHFKGSVLRLPPTGNEKPVEGETVSAKVRVLLERAIAYGETEWKKEKEFLEKAAK